MDAKIEELLSIKYDIINKGDSYGKLYNGEF